MTASADDRWRQLAAANPGQAIYPQRLYAAGIWPRVDMATVTNRPMVIRSSHHRARFVVRWWKQPVLPGTRRPWWRRWAWCVLHGFDEVAEGTARTRLGARRQARQVAAAREAVARLLEAVEGGRR